MHRTVGPEFFERSNWEEETQFWEERKSKFFEVFQIVYCILTGFFLGLVVGGAIF